MYKKTLIDVVKHQIQIVCRVKTLPIIDVLVQNLIIVDYEWIFRSSRQRFLQERFWCDRRKSIHQHKIHLDTLLLFRSFILKYNRSVQMNHL